MKIESKQFQFAILAILVFAFAFIAFYHLGNKPLLDYDESIYAQVARQALENKNQLGFQWLGNIGLNRSEFWFEKPPLMVWLTETAYLTFGVTEFAARFWTAIFAVLTFLLTFFFVKKISQSFIAAILAISVYFISFQFIYNAGVLQFDIPVGFFILFSLFAFWQAKEKSKYYLLFWASVGLGILTKSVIGLLPLPIVFLYSVLSYDFEYLKDAKFYYGILLFLLIILPWHIIEYLKYGTDFLNQYLFYHLLKRFASPLEGNTGPFSFYWDIVSKYRLLFFSSIISFVYFLIKSFKSKKYLFLTIATIFVFVFFSYAKTKLPAYILVIYPFLAAIIGITFGDFAEYFFKNHEKIGQTLIFCCALAFIILGFKYKQYELLKENEQYLLGSKAAGIYLKNNNSSQDIYYYSTTGTKPSTIFYSNKIVYFLKYPSPKPKQNFLLLSEIKPDFQNVKILFSTPTQAVYQVQ